MNALLSLLALAFPANQDLNKLVTAEIRAASAPVAIEELSKQVGFPLTATASTKEDVLIIKVKDVPLSALLARVAQATNAEWEQVNGGYRLIRTDPIRRKEAASEQERLAKMIQASFDKNRKAIAEELAVTDRGANLTAEKLIQMQERRQGGLQVNDWQQEQKLRSEGPAYRLMRRISVTLDANTLAGLPPSRNVVMSNSPNRSQYALPTNIQPLVQTFVKEQAIWAKAMKNARDRRGGNQHFYYENMLDPTNRKIGKVVLVLNRSAQSRGVQARLIISDDRGRLLGQAQENFGWDWESYSQRIQELQRTANANEPEIKFSGPSKQLYDSMREVYKSAQANGGQPDINVSQEVKELLLNPDKTEPLSLLASDCVLETARIRDLDIVCSAPDMMIMGIGPTGSAGPKPSTFLASLTGAETETEGSWVVIKPTVPSIARKIRIDRVVLGQYLRQAAKEGRVSLENRASYAYRSGQEEENYLPTYIMSMSGLLRAGMEYGGDWDTLRFYGSLTPPQRQAAKNAQPIPFRSLQRDQLEMMRHIVFDSSWPRLEINYQEEDFAEAQAEDGVIYGGGLDSEPTEILPNGFTGTEVLTITDQTQPRFFTKPEADGNQQFYYGESAQDLNGIAYEIFQRERPELFPWMSQPGYSRGKISKIRTGDQRTIMFKAQFTRRASLDMNLTDKMYRSEEMSMDKLPADIKKQLDEALAKIREQHKNSKPPNWNPGGGGGTLPPPPPR